MSRLNGDYELGRRLGGGAEGDVYEAVSAKNGRKVAVKILKRPGNGLLEAILELKGARIQSCAAVLDAFELDGGVVVVLELVDGVPLREYLAAKDWAPSRRQELAREILRRVRALNHQGRAHGDLSPDNVFVGRDGSVTFLDPRIPSRRTGSVHGTANYAAPEMLAQDSVPDPRADAFSAAALVYEVFEGRDPFGCRSPEEYVFKAGARSLTPRSFEKTPPSFRPAVAAALDLDPRARIQSAARMLALLDAPRHRRLAALAAALLLGAAGVRAWNARSRAIDSIAVLPFIDQSGDPEAEYLSEGLTESIINELARLPDVRVSPRGAVFRYKGGAVDPAKAARELGVRAVLTGRLQKRGDGLTVSAELLDARDDKQVWGERYDREGTAALDVQKELSRKISESLRAKTGSPGARRPDKRGTDVPEAYQAYLKGRYFWNRRTSANIGKALAQFQLAVDADPAYASAYLGLADAYALMPQYAGASSPEVLPKARAAARRALEIDDTLAEAHASLGYIEMMSWRFDEAEKEFRRALAMDPDHPTANLWYGTFLNVAGRLDLALPRSRRARELDPLSAIAGVQVCNLLLLKGELDPAADACRKVLELDEKFPRAHDLLGWIHLKQGRASAGLAELEKAVDGSGRASQELGYLGYGYGRAGRRDDALRVLRELEKRHAERKAHAMFLAAVYAGLDEKDRAFEWLDKDFRAKNGTLVYVTYFPIYDTLRDDPRYADLLRRMGIR